MIFSQFGDPAPVLAHKAMLYQFVAALNVQTDRAVLPAFKRGFRFCLESFGESSERTIKSLTVDVRLRALAQTMVAKGRGWRNGHDEP